MQGVGLGLRYEIAEKILALNSGEISFLELAPESWMGVGGNYRKIVQAAQEKYPVAAHGVSLSLGSHEPLDWEFLKQLKKFFSECPVRLYSEHLSFSKSKKSHLYEFLPIPFTDEAVKHVANRIKEVQDFLEMKIAIENIPYYCLTDAEMEECDFISRVVEDSGCLLLLDVNNVYVNAFNHKYDASEFIRKIPLDKIAYIQMGGHTKVSDELMVSTLGSNLVDPVYKLFESVVQKIAPVPVLLERDHHFEDFESLLTEMEILRMITQKHWVRANAAC